MVICLELVADLHMAQLMPMPLTVSCFSKIQIGFACLVRYRLTRKFRKKGRQMGVCVCVCVCVSVNIILTELTLCCSLCDSQIEELNKVTLILEVTILTILIHTTFYCSKLLAYGSTVHIWSWHTVQPNMNRLFKPLFGADVNTKWIFITARFFGDCYMTTWCLQCFDAVGWAAGRASGL